MTICSKEPVNEIRVLADTGHVISKPKDTTYTLTIIFLMTAQVNHVYSSCSASEKCYSKIWTRDSIMNPVTAY